MKLELIQPFISAVDAVLADTMQCPITIHDLSMEDDAYRKKGVAALIAFKGAIEGRVILDMELSPIAKVASYLAGEDITLDDQIMRETVSELANMVIGNAVTILNDRGSSFKVFPPELISEDQIKCNSVDTEATVLSFQTEHGNVYMNISLHYNRRRQRERSVVAVS
ncbi:MAG TPA: chemotaxis protein CheX [Candidatus Acidoferrales bacterium]|nr:chemotaxis protein CheX [Candidatus Acidoferrales bacterium]